MKIEENLFFLDLTDLLPNELKEKIDILNALICKWVAEENIMPKESAEKIKIEFTIENTEIKKNNSEGIYDNGFIPKKDIDIDVNLKNTKFVYEFMGDA